MASFLNNIIGNPFSTPIGQLIEKATNDTNENWALYMEICDRINSTEEGPRDSIKAFKKQLSSSTSNTSVFLTTLFVLETCVKNCGHRFHKHVAQKDFIQEFTCILTQKATPPVHCVDRVLGLLQTWADAFQGDPDLKEVEATCKELKTKGFEFPVEDIEHAPPIHTPARKSLPPSKAPAPCVASSTSNTAPNHPIPNVHPAPLSDPRLAPPTPPSINSPQMEKLKKELNVVSQNCKIFSELLTENSPGKESQEDWQLMKDLATTNTECHRRLVELVGNYTIEEITSLVLPVNDQVTNMCLRFERYERMRRGVLDKKDKSSGVETKTAENTEASSMFSAMPNKLNGTTPAGYRDDDFAEVSLEPVQKDQLFMSDQTKTATDAFNPFAMPHSNAFKPKEAQLSEVSTDFKNLKTSSHDNFYSNQEVIASSNESKDNKELATSQEFESFLASHSSNQNDDESDKQDNDSRNNESN